MFFVVSHCSQLLLVVRESAYTIASVLEMILSFVSMYYLLYLCVCFLPLW